MQQTTPQNQIAPAGHAGSARGSVALALVAWTCLLVQQMFCPLHLGAHGDHDHAHGHQTSEAVAQVPAQVHAHCAPDGCHEPAPRCEDSEEHQPHSLGEHLESIGVALVQMDWQLPGSAQKVQAHGVTNPPIELLLRSSILVRLHPRPPPDSGAQPARAPPLLS